MTVDERQQANEVFCSCETTVNAGRSPFTETHTSVDGVQLLDVFNWPEIEATRGGALPADEDIVAGRLSPFDSVDKMLASLKG